MRTIYLDEIQYHSQSVSIQLDPCWSIGNSEINQRLYCWLDQYFSTVCFADTVQDPQINVVSGSTDFVDQITLRISSALVHAFKRIGGFKQNKQENNNTEIVHLILNQDYRQQNYMKFGFSLKQLFQNDASILCLGNRQSIRHSSAKNIINIQSIKFRDYLSEVINTMGKESSKNLEVKMPITTHQKFVASSDRIYLNIENQIVIGFMRVGKKILYYFTKQKCQKLQATCVLDFYVHQRYQRAGHGKKIFEYFLANEGLTAQKIGYDKPSQKLLSFLRRHYNLIHFTAQTNHFVIFDAYFMPDMKSNKSDMKTQLENEQNKLYQNIEDQFHKKQMPQRSFMQNNSLLSNQHDYNYLDQFSNNMYASAKTNSAFKAIQKLSLSHQNITSFGYYPNNQHDRTLESFQEQKNNALIRQSELRKQSAMQEIDNLKNHIQNLESSVRGSFNFATKLSSSEYGKRLK